MATHQRFRMMMAATTALALLGAAAFAMTFPGGPLSAPPAPAGGPPKTVEVHLTASVFNWTIAPNVTLAVWGYNGQIPGPEIRLREGDTLNATLHNELPAPTTVHWHGMEVPASQDGVPGLSQHPILPGANYTYEFVATHAGTFFYHSHYDEADQVDRGLAGALIVEPRGGLVGVDREYVLVLDEWAVAPAQAVGTMPEAPRMPVPSDMMNMSDEELAALHAEMHAYMSGVMEAMMSMMMGGGHSTSGGNATMDQNMTMGGMGHMSGMGNSTVGWDGMTANMTYEERVAHMESMAAMVEMHSGMADQMDSMMMDGSMGMGGSMDNYNYWTINGKSYPLTSPLNVTEGGRVLVRIINVGVMQTHPMHLHGHDMQVVATDGHALTAPYFKDTLPVAPGERYDVLIAADNPGVWAFHCHELHHLANGDTGPGGMMTTFAYEGALPLGGSMPPMDGGMGGGHGGH